MVISCVVPSLSHPQAADKEHDPLAKGRVAWGAPLQHDWAASSAPRQVDIDPVDQDTSSGYAALGGAASAAAGLVAAATAVAAAAQPPPASALSLAMRLVEGSQAAGITGTLQGGHRDKEGEQGCRLLHLSCEAGSCLAMLLPCMPVCFCNWPAVH